MKYILKTIVGSQAHGLATPESDFDYRGVFVVPTSEMLRIEAKIKETQWIEGKTDDTSWEIGHFLKMAVHCNPTILETFLAPFDPEWYVNTNLAAVSLGEELRNLFPYVWNSKEVYEAFRGYSKNQQTKFLDGKDSRPHKYASAYLRVLYQGVQLLKTGSFTVDFRETEIYDTLKQWKNKEYTRAEVMGLTEDWEITFAQAYADNPDKESDIERVNEFLLKVRKENWE